MKNIVTPFCYPTPYPTREGKNWRKNIFLTIVFKIEHMKADVVIPPKSNRKKQRDYDNFLYKERSVSKRMLGKMKHFRRRATRYSKMTVSFLGFIQFAAILLWIK